MSRSFLALILALVVGLGLYGGASAVASASAGQPTAPAPDTIVQVDGDAANGFDIHYYDGSVDYPPTDSESMAECSEYDTMRQRVQCRVEVRTWYRDLADLQQALDWAHAQPAA